MNLIIFTKYKGISSKTELAMHGNDRGMVPTFKISPRDLVFEEISTRTIFMKKSEDFSSKALEDRNV